MDVLITRRRFGVGIAAMAGAAAIGVPVGNAAAGRVAPLPVHALGAFNELVQSNARRLEHLAWAVGRSEARFDTDRQSRIEWPRLYEDMIDAAWSLQHKGIWGRSPREMAMLSWAQSIYADDETRSLLPRQELVGISPEHQRRHADFEARLLAQARAAGVNGTAMEHTTAKRAATRTAWSITELVPEVRCDMQVHRLAVEYLFSDDFVFERRYRQASAMWRVS